MPACDAPKTEVKDMDEQSGESKEEKVMDERLRESEMVPE